MSDPFIALRNSYPHMVTAEALFFHYGTHYAIRVEAPTIGLEFTDHAYIGSDPEGFLFYRDLKDFGYKPERRRTSKYKVSTITFGNKLYVLVKFYHNDENNSYAQFIGEDPTRAVAGASMEGYSREGNWDKLKIGSVTATVYKDSDDTSITMEVDTIHKKAIWRAAQAPSLVNASVEVQGILYFKDLNTINTGTFVSYNDDRLVFYANAYSGTDFTAYFIPLENQQQETLGYSGAGLELSGVAWSNA
ncbi:hypothetical protein BDZ94DRAFT_794451 [Collybia nuda]|uniref:Uncharacterized protein n=1 Tax=Collybia nuda TaxID=64659 RepID=A0A9P5Y5Z4_9AGAR|nr:hypothetical protein BDZ94DRAFT_794451 [Collybia nuda]